MGKYDDDEGGYFCELLKEGLTERDMSGLERGWFIGVGLIGAVVADPVLWITIREIPRIRSIRIIKFCQSKSLAAFLQTRLLLFVKL